MRAILFASVVCWSGTLVSAEPPPIGQTPISGWEEAADVLTGSYFNGNKLLDEFHKDRGFSFYYVAGVHDALKVRKGFCTRGTVSLAQLGDVVEKYLTNNPASRDQQAQILVRRALTEAFPCPPGQ